MTPEEILLYIKDIPLKEVLQFLNAKGIIDLSKKGYESVKEFIKKKSSEKKYGFVPKADEGNVLVKVAEKPYFVNFAYALSKHRYSDLIRVGYLVSHLNKIGGSANRERVEIIRDAIRNMPNGFFLTKIVNLVTTGAIVPVVDHLCGLKNKKYDEDYITNVFDDIIQEWQKYTYFVKAEDPKEEIMIDIKQRIANNQNLIMVFSYGSAKNNTTLAIAELLKAGVTKNYHYESNNNIEGEKEVHSSTFTLMDF